MSRTTDEWIGKTDDEPAPPRVRQRLFDTAQGQCQKCTRKLYPGQWSVDHVVALINGGENRERNLQILCTIPCHSDKTRADVKQKATTARKRARNIGIKKPRTMTRWRKFNGEIVTATRER
jgi:5-methylcytosine-specific restriction endonuclease McrA